jgi:predicted RecB family nuclease
MISSHLFEAYLECPTKCWLRAQNEPSTGNVYSEWARVRNETYRKEWLERRLAIAAEADRKEATWRFAVDMRVQVDGLECQIPAVERVRSEGHGRRVQFIPHRFEFSNKLTKQHKLMVAFDAVVLSEAMGRDIRLGKIIHGDRFATLNVKTSSLISEARMRIGSCAALAANTSPPDLVLNRHCGQCEFQGRCHKQATEKADLSLLGGMSDKERKKLHDKGIFTVTQLSYTFRPRRRRRHAQDRPEKYHHSLRALAIRKDKIHVVDVPDQKIEGTPVYLDVEGLPDRDFYYLIGVRVGNGDGVIQHGFWADDADGEKRIWEKFQGVLATISNPRIIHYGSYETSFLKRMCQRHGGPIVPGLFDRDELRRRLIVALNMAKVVQHIWKAIRFENTERLDPIFDRERPIRSTGDMKTWYTGKPCERTARSHINFCVYDSTWESSESFELDNNREVEAWVKNDHLGLEIVYTYQGVVRKYRPDFLIRLKSGRNLVLETKGRDTDQDRTKREFRGECVSG